LHGRQADLKRTCASPGIIGVLPENEISPAFMGGFLFVMNIFAAAGTDQKRITDIF